MNASRRRVACAVVIAFGFLGSARLSGQETHELMRYRSFALNTSLDQVAKDSGVSAGTAKTVHEHPALIQELVRRTPYPREPDVRPDPVHEVALTFYNGALYRILVRYDRVRMEGLTSRDVVEAVTETYGPPLLASTVTPTDVREDASAGRRVLARWDGPESQLTLARGTYSSEFQLTLVSKSLRAPAERAVEEAIRREATEAPRRAAEQRRNQATDANVLLEKARTINKAAFRP